MDYIAVFNANIEEFIQDDPDSKAATTIRKLLSEQRSHNYYLCLEKYLKRHGLRFYAISSDTHYLPCLEYLEVNAFGEKAHRNLLRKDPIIHDYCHFILAKEIVEILNERMGD